MSALSHYLEQAGIATIGISLVREHTEAMAPPRSLWVPYPLGRPLGVPGDAPFQLGVMRAALALLDRESGPILEDYNVDAPADEVADEEAWVCPVSFATKEDGELDVCVEATRQETSNLLSNTGAVATANFCPGGPSEAIDTLQRFVSGSRIEFLLLRNAVEELKSFYELAAHATGLRGQRRSMAWFWQETHVSRLLELVSAECESRNDGKMSRLADNIIPRAARSLIKAR